MNVLVEDPGHESFWLGRAVWVGRDGEPNPRGRSVRGDAWEYDGRSGRWTLPVDSTGRPVTLTCPRLLAVRVDNLYRGTQAASEPTTR